MRIRNSKHWRRHSPAQAWLGTVLIVAGAFTIRYSLHRFVEPFAVFHFFTVGCLLIEFLFGYQFAVPSMLVSVALAEYFFIEPYGSFSDPTRKDYLISLNFIGITGLTVVFIEHLQRNKYARELLLKAMASRYQISLERENDRQFHVRQSEQAGSILESLLTHREQVLLMRFGAQEAQPGTGLYRLAPAERWADLHYQWQTLFHPEDLALLQRQLDTPEPGTTLRIRLPHADGQSTEHRVDVQRVDFRSQPLVILKLASQEAPAPAQRA